MSDYGIRGVSAADVYELREALLLRRRGGSPSVPGDEDPTACHLAAYRDEARVGIGSIHPEPMPDGSTADTWRLHGVAVDHGHRGVGVGALIVERCLEHAAEHGARAVWCLAPAGVFGFFERYGFQRMGDPIDDPEGPQYKLFAEIEPLRRSWSL